MENNNKHTPEVTEVTGKKAYMPEHYTEASEPFFRGKGDHNVLELEQICEEYKEYAHQADIAFYSCSRKADSLTRELSELREERDRLRLTLSGKTFFDEREVMQKEIDGLREENERLKEGLKDIMRFEASLRSVMSDNLQYPDNFMKALDNATQLLQSKKP